MADVTKVWYFTRLSNGENHVRANLSEAFAMLGTDLDGKVEVHTVSYEETPVELLAADKKTEREAYEAARVFQETSIFYSVAAKTVEGQENIEKERTGG